MCCVSSRVLFRLSDLRCPGARKVVQCVVLIWFACLRVAGDDEGIICLRLWPCWEDGAGSFAILLAAWNERSV